ncbi:LysM repeat protein [Dysgonomonas sp. PH5-45]|uniref:amino acid ABC transporter substrate-binding protein n=1 Tax=unclassified Dysgonomonas TaxID=2630389 RepID=UPI0024766BA3|nr:MULTISPECIES: LysM domain-containing protein [unclassified Dysgonomonas]MDH6355041.1 LysM repeat protein [Dysgonomonas sp. PH5-45]MDH6387941.1 LysM repeat protein [Dysgonomonas sp. PH5-37]
MKKKSIALLFTTLFFFVGVNVALANNPKKSTNHVVAPGETAYSLAKANGITLNELYAANPKAKEGMKVGDVLVIPQTVKYFSYKPEKGETLYSISKKFNTTVEDILNANPKLGTEGIKEGKAIRVPETSPVSKPQQQTTDKIIHKVAPKETLYGISRMYDVTVEDLLIANPSVKSGLAMNQELVIPAKGKVVADKSQPATNATTPRQEVVATEATKDNKTKDVVTRVGVLLPFLDKTNNQHLRFIEYYEGMLLAISDLKAKGYSLEVYTFDIGTATDNKKLEALLESSDIANLDMIIGGSSLGQIALLSSYTKQRGIKYVIPFPTKSSDVFGNENAFQVCMSHASMSPKVSRLFTQRFKNYNIILLTDNSNTDKSDFVSMLKTNLHEAGGSVKELQMTSELSESLPTVLSSSAKNIIVPSSSTSQTLGKLLAGLKALSANQTAGQYDISLFGYPDWQAYTNVYGDLRKFNAIIYTSFFVEKNCLSSFEAKYKRAYNKTMMVSFPKYAMLGYDTGMFFLPLKKEYGKDFEDKMSKVKYTPLQTAFHFITRSKNEGYLNNGIYFVCFKDLGIEKVDLSKE